MPKLSRKTWQEELEIIDRTMKKISTVTDPDELVKTYWNGIGSLVPVNHYISLSRRTAEPPRYTIPRPSRFNEYITPWTQRDRLPVYCGGVLGEVMYSNEPLVIDDLPARLSKD